ncbi:hypothetical protein F5888DRAFT_1804847 [Russula emetica]|nr:hypothetical protein F5888DRAFT_1804847 [Russula emetica]
MYLAKLVVLKYTKETTNAYKVLSTKHEGHSNLKQHDAGHLSIHIKNEALHASMTSDPINPYSTSPVQELTPVHEAYKLASSQEPVTFTLPPQFPPLPMSSPSSVINIPAVPDDPGPERIDRDGSVGSTNDGATASIISVANNIISLAQELISKAPNDLEIAKSVNLFQSRFSALVLSATAASDGNGSLPEKENIGPNQRSWLETAARMGVKHGNKRREKGKVDSALTAQHISEPNRKRAADNDPYGAGKQSGKRAKPDARSAAANVRARAAQEQAAIKAEPPPAPPARVSTLPRVASPICLILPIHIQSLSFPFPSSISASADVFPLSGGPFGSPILSRIFDLLLLPPHVA